MIVCLCHRVSDRDIHRAVREGCTDFAELQQQTRVSTGCGACTSCARETHAAACAAQGTAPLGLVAQALAVVHTTGRA